VVPKAGAKGLSRLLRVLGPGIITGAADDDPSGIATYSQTGAQYGYGQLWTALFMLPMMIAVQELCARIGAVTGKGLAAVIKDRYPRPVLYAVVLLVVLANVINIGADLGAMASALQLVLPVPFGPTILLIVIAILAAVLLVSYKTMARTLKWMALFLVAYMATAIISGQDWPTVIRATFVPHFELSFGFLFLITGVLGTTISPYMFFWQASEVVEDEVASGRLAQKGGTPKVSRSFLKSLRIDNAIGMVASNIATWFIIITAAAVLNKNGVTNINSAADAARALEPLVHGFPNSGLVAKSLFAVGVVGLGFLAVPVLAGSASYALSEAFGWKEGLYRRFPQARGFYAVIALALFSGLLINFIGIDPVKALVFTAVFNGVAAVPLIFVLAKVGSSSEVMGEYKSGLLSRVLVWITFAAMGLAAVAMAFTLGRG
jgi:NRAMP (natural resistance-associated macrophage protein)-like metal ion transporter